MKKIILLIIIFLFFLTTLRAEAVLDSKWQATELFGQKISEKLDRKATIDFRQNKAEGVGNDGCNSIYFKYSINGSKINIKNLTSTQMYCSSRRKKEEKQIRLLVKNYKSALLKAKSYEILGEILVFKDSTNVIAKFKKILSPEVVESLDDGKLEIEEVADFLEPES